MLTENDQIGMKKYVDEQVAEIERLLPNTKKEVITKWLLSCKDNGISDDVFLSNIEEFNAGEDRIFTNRQEDLIAIFSQLRSFYLNREFHTDTFTIKNKAYLSDPPINVSMHWSSKKIEKEDGSEYNFDGVESEVLKFGAGYFNDTIQERVPLWQRILDNLKAFLIGMGQFFNVVQLIRDPGAYWDAFMQNYHSNGWKFAGNVTAASLLVIGVVLMIVLPLTLPAATVVTATVAPAAAIATPAAFATFGAVATAAVPVVSSSVSMAAIAASSALIAAVIAGIGAVFYKMLKTNSRELQEVKTRIKSIDSSVTDEGFEEVLSVFKKMSEKELQQLIQGVSQPSVGHAELEKILPDTAIELTPIRRRAGSVLFMSPKNATSLVRPMLKEQALSSVVSLHKGDNSEGKLVRKRSGLCLFTATRNLSGERSADPLEQKVASVARSTVSTYQGSGTFSQGKPAEKDQKSGSSLTFG